MRRKGVCSVCGGETCKPKFTRCFSCKVKDQKPIVPREDYVKEWQQKKKYGLEQGEFDALWIAYRGKCGICGCTMNLPKKQRGQPLDVVAIDHDHKTGKARGLLCNKCNKGLGFFNDDPDLLKEAIKWVTTGKKEH